MGVARHIRALQSRFPSVLEAKARLQRDWRKLRRRPFEADFQILAHLRVPPGQCLVDVGANRGQSIDAMRLFHPEETIHAFEPASLLADKLDSMFDHDKNLVLHRVGLGEKPSTQILYTPVYRGFVYDGLASFKREEASKWLNAETVANFDARALTIHEAPAQIACLDDFDVNPAFIKLDVQGFERAALAGAMTTLSKHEPLVMLESNPDADDFLIQQGWKRAAWDRQSQLRVNQYGDLNTFYLSLRRLEALSERGLVSN
jgi:FkbM family methyltransferase